jgi:type IV secretory pathway TraG/TraD family ATPase VirD4
MALYGDAELLEFVPDGWTGAAPILYSERGAPAIPLGFDTRWPLELVVPWQVSAHRGHSLCFSATGGGKNTNLITPALLTYRGSCLCLDPKGENAWVSAPRRRAMGQRVYILDPYNRVNETFGKLAGSLETVSKFNPLSGLDPTSPEFADEVTVIADGVIMSSDKDLHWTESAKELVSGLIAAVVEKAPGVGSFRTVRELLTMPDDVLARTVKLIVQSNPGSLAARKLARFADADPENKEIASIRSTAITQTAIFDAAFLLDSMDTGPSALNLAELGTRPTTVYVVLPADKLATHGRWMRLVTQLALKAVTRQSVPPRPPVLFLLDELGTINPGYGLKSIEQAYGLLGGLGVRIWGFFQDLGQLQRDYPNSWETFIANSETIQLMRLNENNTAKYFSEHIGMTTWAKHPGGQWEIDTSGHIFRAQRYVAPGGIVQYISNARIDPSNPNSYPGIGPVEETQFQQRAAIMPQELTKLKNDRIILLFTGRQGNYHIWSIPYFKDPRLTGKYRHNPLHDVSSVHVFAKRPPPPVKVDPPPVAPPPVAKPFSLGLDRLKGAFSKPFARLSEVDKEVTAKATEWAKTDGLKHAQAAADWAKSDGVEHARKAAAVASDHATKAADWAAGRLSAFRKRGDTSTDTPPDTEG